MWKSLEKIRLFKLGFLDSFLIFLFIRTSSRILNIFFKINFIVMTEQKVVVFILFYIAYVSFILILSNFICPIINSKKYSMIEIFYKTNHYCLGTFLIWAVYLLINKFFPLLNNGFAIAFSFIFLIMTYYVFEGEYAIKMSLSNMNEEEINMKIKIAKIESLITNKKNDR